MKKTTDSKLIQTTFYRKNRFLVGKPGRSADATIHSGETFTDFHRHELLAQGWTLVRGVFSKEKCASLVDQAHSWAEGLGSGIGRHDPKTWTSTNWPFNIHGIIQTGDVGHSDWIWDIRKGVQPLFGDMYKTSRLVTSFDGASYDPPQEQSKILQHIESKALMHVDQGASKQGLHSVQGFVTLFDIDECDSTLRIVPESHLHQQELFKRLLEETTTNKEDAAKLEKADGYRFSDKQLEQIAVKEFGLYVKRVSMPAGSMVLWDSRLIHGKGGPRLPRPVPRWRIVSYVCMTPAHWCTNTVLRKRIKAFEEGRMTSHLPHKVKLFSATPRTYGSRKLIEKWEKFRWRTDPPELDAQMRGLVGYSYLYD